MSQPVERPHQGERNVSSGSRMGAVRLAAGAAAMVVVALTAPVFSQSVVPAAFEMADVRVSPERINVLSGMVGGAIRNGLYEVRNATMLDLIRTAYGVQGTQVVDGPSWLEVDIFDVVGKVPAGTTVEQARLMLRRVLADRFKLVVREEQRSATRWVLSQAAGGELKLVRSTNTAVPGACRGQQEPPNVKLVCRNMTLTAFSEQLGRAFQSYVSGPVTDATGLTGPWDFEFAFTSKREEVEALGAKGISLFTALTQLGLTLEYKLFSTAALAVASVRTPSANPPGIEKVIPPRPAPAFEVATIRRGPPGVTGGRNVIRQNAQIDATNMPLRELIKTAWGFESNERVVGPAWIETARFDIVGRAYTASDAPFLAADDLRLALRKLLVDRFQIKFHYEDRPVNTYALLAGTVKMTKGDPTARTRCYQGVPQGAKDPRQANPTRRGLMTCHNTPMSHFVRLLPAVAGPGYIQNPIAEMTGLTGGWDFTLNWSNADLFPAGIPGVAPTGDRPLDTGIPVASTPTGAITLPEAVESQLGLKLQMGRHPVRVLVIDQIAEEPIQN